MKQLVGLLILLLGALAYGQQSRAYFKVKPKSAMLYLDGDTIGTADGAKFFVGFNERKGITEHEVELRAEGYDTYTQTLKIDMPARSVYTIEMERTLPTMDPAPEYHIDFSKALSGIEYNREVGTKAYWLFRYDEELTMAQGYYDLLEALDRIGMNTTTDEDGKAVLDDEMNPVVPDVLVSARINDLNVNRRSYSYSGNTARSSISWTFTDRRTGDTIAMDTVRSDYDFQSSDINTVLPKAFVESFYILFYKNQPLIDTLQNHVPGKVKSKPAARALDSAALDTVSADSTAVLDTMPAGNAEPTASSVPPKIDDASSDSTSTMDQPTEAIESAESMASNLGGEVASIVGKTSADLILPKPRSSGSKKQGIARAGISLMENEGVVGHGYIASEEGHLLLASDANLSDSMEVLFANGIVLKAGRLAAREGFAVYKVDAGSLEALPPWKTDAKLGTRYTYPIPPQPGKVELRTSTAQIIRIGDRYQVESRGTDPAAGLPLCDQKGRVIGMFDGSRTDDLWNVVDLNKALNVLKVDYE